MFRGNARTRRRDSIDLIVRLRRLKHSFQLIESLAGLSFKDSKSSVVTIGFSYVF
jgi:hypothetical protein